ncbi:MAG: right-handed parallel beta-helix repeat-containing protein, partial [Armatimonadota bacterium]|nr:right-handed parallel beta-helix repeat-containing protein [Armatimonadota bacterium]
RFDYAITRTLPGGTITALNAGDYGSVFIQQAVTIDGEGTQASIVAGLSHTTSAITISAAATDAVILRGLTLNGAGGGPNLLGVSFQAGGSLVLDHCAFSGFGGAGLDLETGVATVLHTTFTQCATGVQISGGLVSLRDVTLQGGRSGIVNNAGVSDIKDSLIAQNSQFGVVANNGSVSVSGCTLSGNGVAAQSAPNATLRLTDNNLWNNGTALRNGGGIIATTGDNRRAGNATAGQSSTDQPNRSITVQ